MSDCDYLSCSPFYVRRNVVPLKGHSLLCFARNTVMMVLRNSFGRQ